MCEVLFEAMLDMWPFGVDSPVTYIAFDIWVTVWDVVTDVLHIIGL